MRTYVATINQDSKHGKLFEVQHYQFYHACTMRILFFKTLQHKF